ncbi:MAG TPA: succinate dehydrogenase [Blastocatellia bacterium]|nr:succinate dehydrogenase [Blastocatellia bacterium]
MAIQASRHFVLRKAHQLTGVIPLGVFLLEHLYTNSRALGSVAAGKTGAQLYNASVADLRSIPYIVFIEIFGIFLPMVFHGVYGLVLARESRLNVRQYGYGRNWLYVLQRLSGVFLFLFITFHLLNFRFGLLPGLNQTPVSEHPNQAFWIVRSEFQHPAILSIYIAGIIVAVFHLAHGLWLFSIDWGIAVGRRTQKILAYTCAVFGLVLAVIGVNAAAAFVR